LSLVPLSEPLLKNPVQHCAWQTPFLELWEKKRSALAMSIIGYVTSIPVFCDSGFVILSPLNKALAKRAGIPLATMAVALSHWSLRNPYPGTSHTRTYSRCRKRRCRSWFGHHRGTYRSYSSCFGRPLVGKPHREKHYH